MTETVATDDSMYTAGPLTAQWNALQYLEDNSIPGLFDSLVAGLILEQPEDPMSYLDTKLEQVKAKGVEKVSWESFVLQLHPLRRQDRQKVVQDGKLPPRQEPAAPPTPSIKPEAFAPEVFRLTEPDQ